MCGGLMQVKCRLRRPRCAIWPRHSQISAVSMKLMPYSSQEQDSCSCASCTTVATNRSKDQRMRASSRVAHRQAAKLSPGAASPQITEHLHDGSTQPPARCSAFPRSLFLGSTLQGSRWQQQQHYKKCGGAQERVP